VVVELEHFDEAALETLVGSMRQRGALNPVEQARACDTLTKQLGLTHREVGERVGRSTSGVANLMRLLKLSEEALEFIGRGELGMAHGLALLVARDPEVRRNLAREAAKQGWTVPELEGRARASNGDAPTRDLPMPRSTRKRPTRKRQQPKEPTAPAVTSSPRVDLHQAAMIAWATALGAITAEALAERDQVSIAVAREYLGEAVGLELMERHSVLVGYPDLYTVTIAGRKLARKNAQAGGYVYPEGLRTARVTIKDARHTIACASVVAALERRYPDHRVLVERELHREERSQRRRLASVNIRRHGRTRSHFPDIVIWPPSAPEEPAPLPVAVEVELTLKSREELTAICRAWARARHVEAVLYYVETVKLEERLLDTIEELKVEDMIIVNPLGEIIESLPGFELSN
jgi:ParB-like chromosome segregation protein Spo0J